tara:strand:- start:43 stop:375 length:333 start_codon:yes stop_codon:yes gene_type:complete
MHNDYELIDVEEEYIKDISNNNTINTSTINIDRMEYLNIIKKLMNKNSLLETEMKKKDVNFIDLNKKYLDTLDELNYLNKDYSQLEIDLSDMETVNMKLLDIIKKKDNMA